MTESRYVQLSRPDIKLHYLEAGAGEPVLLLHGWPTSSYLWRDTIPAMAASHRVIALDLPGYGLSDKPLDVSYSLPYYEEVLAAFLDALDIAAVNLVVHDIGGPIGLYWAVHHREQVLRLGLLNTFVYLDISTRQKLYYLGGRIPGLKQFMVSQYNLAMVMRGSVHNKQRMTKDIVRSYLQPFVGKDARRALSKAIIDFFNEDDMATIARELPRFDIPVLLLYGENDRALPEIARTMDRVAREIRHTERTTLPDCGHLLQEDAGPRVGERIAEFLSR